MMMTKSIWVVILAIVLILILILSLSFQPLFFRRNFIDRIVNFEMPRTAQIIDYKFGINTWGVEPFFVKLELSQEEYDVFITSFCVNEEHLRMFNRMQQRFNYESINVDDIVEIGWRFRITSRQSIFLVATSRHIQSILISTNDGGRFLYIFYGPNLRT